MITRANNFTTKMRLFLAFAFTSCGYSLLSSSHISLVSNQNKIINGHNLISSLNSRVHRSDETPEDDIDFDAFRSNYEKIIKCDTKRERRKCRESVYSHLVSSSFNSEDYPTPPMSTTAKDRRRMEIQLLKSLEDTDRTLSDLWALWFSERGAEPASNLLRAEELSSQGSSQWYKSEEKLKCIIEDEGIHWAEPLNRLATLFYQQGRLKESKALCEAVLSVKPWHFGALSGITLVCAAMGDSVNARIWSDRRLPPLQENGDNELRKIWVTRAVKEATLTLSRSIKVESTLENSVSKQNRILSDDTGLHPENFKDSWQ